jgi:hypothetical protein
MIGKRTPGTSARKVPAHVPGQEIELSLLDLPLFLQLRGLRAMTRAEVDKREQQLHIRKAPGVVWLTKDSRD